MNWSGFFSQGGYALYVWGSYLITFAVLAAEVLLIVRCGRNISQPSAQRTVSKTSAEPASRSTIV
jgi:heme exporter protein CcmD